MLAHLSRPSFFRHAGQLLTLAGPPVPRRGADLGERGSIQRCLRAGPCRPTGEREPGRQADLVVMDVDDYRKIPYYGAWNHCLMTVKRGKIIYRREG